MFCPLERSVAMSSSMWSSASGPPTSGLSPLGILPGRDPVRPVGVRVPLLDLEARGRRAPHEARRGSRPRAGGPAERRRAEAAPRRGEPPRTSEQRPPRRPPHAETIAGPSYMRAFTMCPSAATSRAGRTPWDFSTARWPSSRGRAAGIGRAHARLCAREGAKVVVNDVGGARDGSGVDASAAAAGGRRDRGRGRHGRRQPRHRRHGRGRRRHREDARSTPSGGSTCS